METFWVTRLEPLSGPSLLDAMHELCDGEKFPTLKTIVDLQRSKARSKTASALPEQRHLSPDEKKRADHAAILSMLWLHYEMDWKLDEFAGDILGRLFGADPTAALEKAKTIYDRPTVARWMADRP